MSALRSHDQNHLLANLPEADFRRFVGRMAAIVLEKPIDGQSFFNGRIQSVDGGDVVIAVGKKNRAERLPLAGIKRAHLEVEF